MSGRQATRIRPQEPENAPEHSSRSFLEESKTPRFPPRQKDDTSRAKEVAADFTDVGKDARNGVLSRKQESKIRALADEVPEAGRDEFIHVARLLLTNALNGQPTPQPDQATVTQAADVALAKVKGDATLLRQWQTYQQLLTTVVLPPNGSFSTIEEARAARNLENTYLRARARQKKLGIELVPKNDKFIKQVASAASLSFRKLNP
jgi:hypothetical protein